MAFTKVSDLAIVPETFLAYTLERSVETNAFFQSGIANVNNVVLPPSGKTTHMPFYTDLDGEAEILSDSAGLTVNKISSKEMKAAVHFQGKAFGNNDLVRMLAGTDPMGGMIDGVASFWSRQYNRIAIASAKGALTAGGAESVLDISAKTGADANLNISAAYDAQQLLGDAQDKLRAYVMHSAVRNYLRKVDAQNFAYVANSQNVPTETYLGKPIIVDDTLAPVAGVYTTMLFGAGALSMADGTDAAVALELDRNKLTGEDFFTTRRRFALHVNGFSWTGESAKISPDLAELATAANWDLVVAPKNQLVVGIKHKIG